MIVTFLEEAKYELDDAIDYYNFESPGLGEQFLQEILNALDRILNYPKVWHPLSENTRRCQTRRFPYGIIYSILENEILIISVSNLHREPTHWKDRVK
ncbi:MAG: type II toxin-antitoxin system RelE/ParE family toxin [Gammaproteobacteria bacterium]|nr:type II toxin-antitoxin system RelE/ParE family toxin [Gammaproteobacteria bacterium]MCW9030534.1 type II toxin-antitoxin system RelE/ParE family toxin [Gammaproteobacteria bacterium]